MLYKRLMEWREAQGWSLSEAAEKSGVSRSLIHDIEHGRANPTQKTLEKLCSIYSKTVSDLIEK